MEVSFFDLPNLQRVLREGVGEGLEPYSKPHGALLGL